MKRMTSFVFSIFLMLSLAGCFSGKLTHSNPLPTQRTQTSFISPQNKDIVWKKMIYGIGDSFFVINNLDKESGFINVSYSGDPCMFVDCGRIYSKVIRAAAREEIYDFPACKEYQSYKWVNKRGDYGITERSMELNGRANIVIQEVENGTHVKVKVMYIVHHRGRLYNAESKLFDTYDESISFTSNSGDSFPDGPKCVANGKFEKRILDILKD